MKRRQGLKEVRFKTSQGRTDPTECSTGGGGMSPGLFLFGVLERTGGRGDLLRSEM